MIGFLSPQRGTMHHEVHKKQDFLNQIHDSIGINQIPGLWGSLAYIPLSLISLILAFQLPSGKHDACHLGSGDNSKVWLQTIQSLVINPSLSPCNFAIHPVLREAVSPSSFTDKRGNQLAEESGLELGFELCDHQPIQESEDELWIPWLPTLNSGWWR